MASIACQLAVSARGQSNANHSAGDSAWAGSERLTNPNGPIVEVARPRRAGRGEDAVLEGPDGNTPALRFGHAHAVPPAGDYLPASVAVVPASRSAITLPRTNLWQSTQLIVSRT